MMILTNSDWGEEPGDSKGLMGADAENLISGISIASEHYDTLNETKPLNSAFLLPSSIHQNYLL